MGTMKYTGFRPHSANPDFYNADFVCTECKRPTYYAMHGRPLPSKERLEAFANRMLCANKCGITCPDCPHFLEISHDCGGCKHNKADEDVFTKMPENVAAAKKFLDSGDACAAIGGSFPGGKHNALTNPELITVDVVEKPVGSDLGSQLDAAIERHAKEGPYEQLREMREKSVDPQPIARGCSTCGKDIGVCATESPEEHVLCVEEDFLHWAPK